MEEESANLNIVALFRFNAGMATGGQQHNMVYRTAGNNPQMYQQQRYFMQTHETPVQNMLSQSVSYAVGAPQLAQMQQMYQSHQQQMPNIQRSDVCII